MQSPNFGHKTFALSEHGRLLRNGHLNPVNFNGLDCMPHGHIESDNICDYFTGIGSITSWFRDVIPTAGSEADTPEIQLGNLKYLFQPC
jgi:hypothetical protein